MIRLVWGTGTASTGKGSYDRALAAAGLHRYNLRHLSSVIPPGATIEISETAPDLGATGNALAVVEARQTSPPGSRAAAGVGWARDEDGAGVFYEMGDHDPESVRDRLETGLQTGMELRGIEPGGGTDLEMRVIGAESSPDSFTTAVVLAAYGTSRPLLPAADRPGEPSR